MMYGRPVAVVSDYQLTSCHPQETPDKGSLLPAGNDDAAIGTPSKWCRWPGRKHFADFLSCAYTWKTLILWRHSACNVKHSTGLPTELLPSSGQQLDQLKSYIDNDENFQLLNNRCFAWKMRWPPNTRNPQNHGFLLIPFYPVSHLLGWTQCHWQHYFHGSSSHDTNCYTFARQGATSCWPMLYCTWHYILA